ncbi:Uncharacterised protein [Helicobacter mustelae]|nr:Uncharacterised protein [Helicobacter mustelae]
MCPWGISSPSKGSWAGKREEYQRGDLGEIFCPTKRYQDFAKLRDFASSFAQKAPRKKCQKKAEKKNANFASKGLIFSKSFPILWLFFLFGAAASIGYLFACDIHDLDTACVATRLADGLCIHADHLATGG